MEGAPWRPRLPAATVETVTENRTLNRSEVAAAAESMRLLLAKIETGELVAGASAVSYLRGALAALDALLGGRPMELSDM